MFSMSGRKSASGNRRPAIAAALALCVLPAARAYAGVEYVTSTFNCTSKLADITQAQTLTVMAGSNVQFEVWGNSVDLTNVTNGLTVSGPAGTTASIIKEHSGVENQGRGCGLVGSAVIALNTPGTLGANSPGKLSFRMPLGDLSNLSMTITAQPTISTAWTTNGSLQPSSLPCIVNTGTITPEDQDLKLVIQLPAGHRQDQSTCTSNTIQLRILPSAIGQVNVPGPTMKYTVSGLPSFVTESQSVAVLPNVSTVVTLTFNVLGIRAISTASTSTITFTNPLATNRKTSLTLQVLPNLGQGFAQVASANPSTTTAGNPIDFTLKLSAPAGGTSTLFASSPKQQAIDGQTIITWRMTTASCFAQAVTEAPYSAGATFQHFVFPAGQTSAIIRIRSVAGGGCTDPQHPVTHIFEAWIGDNRIDPQVTTVTSGPKYTKTLVSLSFQ